jgi:hypothetical protein
MEPIFLTSHSRNSQHFKEPEGSLSSSQEAAIGLYPEPNELGLYLPNLFLEDLF